MRQNDLKNRFRPLSKGFLILNNIKNKIIKIEVLNLSKMAVLCIHGGIMDYGGTLTQKHQHNEVQ